MSVVKELIRTEENGTISFGDYTLMEKSKLQDYGFKGDSYKVKTFFEITKLEKNGMFVYESVPGTAVNNFCEDEDGVTFTVEGDKDAQITLGMADETAYDVTIGDDDTGVMSTNRSGKLTLSVELTEGNAVAVAIKKK